MGGIAINGTAGAAASLAPRGLVSQAPSTAVVRPLITKMSLSPLLLDDDEDDEEAASLLYCLHK